MKTVNNRKNLGSFLLAVLLFAVSACTIAQDGTLNLNKKRVLILGDSITQNGMYVSYMQYYLESMYPQNEYDIISIGLSSETASGLSAPGSEHPRPCIFERVDRALAEIKPEVVFACCGMNDGLYHPQNDERFDAYKTGITNLVTKLDSINAEIVLLTPTVFDTIPRDGKVQYDFAEGYEFHNPYYKYDDVLSDYSSFIMNSNFDNTLTIDLHTPMKNFLAERRESDSAFAISKDGVHPNDVGHLLMARTILAGIGIELKPVDNLEDELNRISQDSLFTLVNEYRHVRSEGWLNYIGYTRSGKTVKSSEIESTEKGT